MYVNRSLKDKAMNLIDHALGHPVDPMAETYREYFATEANGAHAQAFRASPHWIEGQRSGDMAYFYVTTEGRAALAAHLEEIGDKNRLFAVTFDDMPCSPVVATTHSKARYDAFLNISDCYEISFVDFCKRATVRLAQRGAR